MSDDELRELFPFHGREVRALLPDEPAVESEVYSWIIYAPLNGDALAEWTRCTPR